MAGLLLVAVGDVNIRSVLEYRLEREGYVVLPSGNRADALAKAKMEQPDLIVLDLALLQANNSSFLEELRSEEATRAIPVLALTTQKQEQLHKRGGELGVTQFVLEPFSLRQLVSDISRYLLKD